MESTLRLWQVGLVILMAVIICAVPVEHEEIGTGNETSRKETASSSTVDQGQRISFMPLFSLLGSFFPKLLKRLSGFTRPQGARDSTMTVQDADYARMNGFYCSLDSLGSWRDPRDCHQFYTCVRNPSSSPVECLHTSDETTPQTIDGNPKQKIETDCLVLALYKCPGNATYSEATARCETQTQCD